MAEELDRNSTFVARVFEATPKWVISVFSVAMGASVAFGFMLSVTGLQAPVNRIVSAYATRIENSVTKLETATLDIKIVATRLEVNEKGIEQVAAQAAAQGKRIDVLESRLDETFRRLRDLELARQKPVLKRD